MSTVPPVSERQGQPPAFSYAFHARGFARRGLQQRVWPMVLLRAELPRALLCHARQAMSRTPGDHQVSRAATPGASRHRSETGARGPRRLARTSRALRALSSPSTNDSGRAGQRLATRGGRGCWLAGWLAGWLRRTRPTVKTSGCYPRPSAPSAGPPDRKFEAPDTAKRPTPYELPDSARAADAGCEGEAAGQRPFVAHTAPRTRRASPCTRPTKSRRRWLRSTEGPAVAPG